MEKKTAGAIATAAFVAGLATGAGGIVVGAEKKKDKTEGVVACATISEHVDGLAVAGKWDGDTADISSILLRRVPAGMCKSYVRGKK